MTEADLPFSQACENNKTPILEALKRIIPVPQAHTHAPELNLLEVGSGTGQHCVHFSQHLPHIQWQPSEQAVYLDSLNQRISRFNSPNLKQAITLDLSQDWPSQCAEQQAIFSANTLHIISQTLVERFIADAAAALVTDGQLIVYGPFNYQGQFTSQSNQEFDAWLKQRDPLSGIRDIEWIIELAKSHSLVLMDDIPMPANNRLLHFQKKA
jgi:cyclopropane fatty-acyl-phospholipid synthase-like methyltransferase